VHRRRDEASGVPADQEAENQDRLSDRVRVARSGVIRTMRPLVRTAMRTVLVGLAVVISLGLTIGAYAYLDDARTSALDQLAYSGA
jgi:hypothetical protein